MDTKTRSTVLPHIGSWDDPKLSLAEYRVGPPSVEFRQLLQVEKRSRASPRPAQSGLADFSPATYLTTHGNVSDPHPRSVLYALAPPGIS